jgi:hypothetical protein
MASSGMLRRGAFVRTDVLQEISASILRVKRIGELGTMLAVTSNRRTVRDYRALRSSCGGISEIQSEFAQRNKSNSQRTDLLYDTPP